MKRKMRIISLLTAIMCTFAFATVRAEFVPVPEICAYVNFSDGSEPVNISVWGSNVVREAGGRKGATMVCTEQSGNLYLLFDVDDKLVFNNPKGTPYAVTVEYFDEGKGWFELGYDSYDAPQDGMARMGGIWNDTDEVMLEDSKTWKTHTFYVDDMKFSNRADGADFRLGLWCIKLDSASTYLSPCDVVIGSVKVERVDYKEPLKIKNITSAFEGNIFGENDEVALDINYENISENDVDAKIDVNVTGEDGVTLWSKSFDRSAKVGESGSVEVKPENIDKFGVYNLNVNTTVVYSEDPDAKPRSYSNKTQFSKAWKVSKEDINDRFGTLTLAYQYDWAAPDGVAVRLAEEAGLGLMREEVQWKDCELSPGAYILPDKERRELAAMKDAGMYIELNLIYANSLYYDNYSSSVDPPTTEKELKAYGNWCEWLARETKGTVQAFSVWNEYNIQHFNTFNESFEHYVTILKVAYEAVKRGNPDAVVVGFESAGIDFNFIRSVFEAGGYQYMDVVAVHPYDWTGHLNTIALVKNNQAIKEIMKQYGEVKPIWWTEMGFNKLFTLEEQASNMVMTHCLQKSFDIAEKVYQFRFQDTLSLVGTVSGEDSWGLCYDYRDPEKPNAAKPSYLAVSAMNNLIGSMAEPAGCIQEGANYAFHFKNSKIQKDVAVIAGELNYTEMAFDFGCDSIDIYDYFGNKMYTMSSDNGIYSFYVGHTPVYAIGNFSKFEQADVKNTAVSLSSALESVANGDLVTFSFKNNTNKHLTVVTDENESLTPYGDSTFTDGVANLSLRVSNELRDSTDIRFRVVDDYGNVVYAGPITVVVDPLDITITTERASGDNHWRAVVTVTNNSRQQTVSGVVKALAPKTEAEFIAPREFKSLNPGDSATLHLNLPPRIIKKTVDLKLGVTLDNGYSEEVSKIIDFSSAQYAYQKPVIDGKISAGEWKGSWFGADDEEHWGTDASVGSKSWKGPEDASFSGIAMWDEENLYILVDAVDDVHFTSHINGVKELWRTDSVQFGIDDRDVDANPIGKNVFAEIGIADDPGEGSVGWRYSTFYALPTDVPLENSDIAVVRRDDGHTVYECRIPWSELIRTDFIPTEGQIVRYSIMLNDSDNGSRGWMLYNDGIALSKNIDLFGRMKLEK